MIRNVSVDETGFNAWLKAKGLGERTVKEYNRYLALLDLDNFSVEYLIQFINKNNNPVARALIKNLFIYIQESDYDIDTKEYIFRMKIPKITGRKKRSLPDYITKEEVIKIGNSLSNPRNKVMLLISFYGALRSSELINIVPDDFKWNEWINKPHTDGKLKIMGKGKRERIVFLPSKVMRYIYQWIINDISGKRKRTDKLFNITQDRWQRILYKASEKAIGHRIHTHTLRHSFATYLLGSDWSLSEIGDYLGHQSVTTTQIYAHVSKDKIKDKFANLR